MKVRLTITFTEEKDNRWQGEVEKNLSLQSTQSVAHDEHSEAFFFDAANLTHAEQVQGLIENWKASDPIAHVEGVGAVRYEVAIIE